MTDKTTGIDWQCIRRSAWLFPALGLVGVLVLTLLRISGSSLAAYDTVLYGPNHHDSNLILGQPRTVRSDEWLVNTQLTLAQSNGDFQRRNPNMAGRLDMSLIPDVPYRDWSELFKPQNWSFFVMPIQQAFAWRWWIIGWALVVGCYGFVLTVLPKRRLLAALLGLSLFFAPFVQWWYQSITLLPVAYAFLIAALLVRSVRASGAARWWLSAALAYFATCFALVLYLPFLIASGLAVAAFFLGYYLQELSKLGWRRWLTKLVPVTVAVIASLGLIGLFIVTRSPAIRAVENTVYPGHRTAASGGYSPAHLFSGYLARNLENNARASTYPINQSEASDFFELWPFLLIPSLILAWRRWRKHHTVAWDLLATNGLCLVFAARLFLPLPTIVTKLLFLSTIPHNRLLIGLGVLGIFQLVLLIKHLNQERLPWGTAGLFALITLVVSIVAGLALRHTYPGFVPRRLEILALSLFVSTIVYAFLKNYAVLGASLLLLLAVLSTAHVNPLYRGLEPVVGSRIDQALKQEQAASPGGWVELGGLYFINLPVANGLPSYSLTMVYPQLNLWHRLDPSGHSSNVYNRYAFVLFTTAPQPTRFELVQADVISVHYDPCDSAFKGLVRHVLATAPVASPCLNLDRTVLYPATTFYLYRVKS